MARVRLENVTKRFEDVTAVDDVSLEVEDGEFVTFVGPRAVASRRRWRQLPD